MTDKQMKLLLLVASLYCKDRRQGPPELLDLITAVELEFIGLHDESDARDFDEPD